MKKNMNDFYEFLASNEDLKKKISLNQFIKAGEKLDKEKLKKIISTEIIPVAKKNGFDLTTEEILDKELSSQGALTEENLADVSGGVNRKTAGIILSLLTVGTGVMSTAANLAFADEGTQEGVIAQEAAQDDDIPAPPPLPPGAPPPPPPAPPGAPAPVVSSNVSIPQGFKKIDMPESKEEIKKLIGIDLPGNFDEIRDSCILLKDGEVVLIYNTATQKLWAENKHTEETEKISWVDSHLYKIQKGTSLRKTVVLTGEAREKARQKFIESLPVRDKLLLEMFKTVEVVYDTASGKFFLKEKEEKSNEKKQLSSKLNASKKREFDASTLDAPSALIYFNKNVESMIEQKESVDKLSNEVINVETSDQLKKMIPKINEILKTIDGSAGRIRALFEIAKKTGKKNAILESNVLNTLRQNYDKLLGIYSAILNAFSKLGFDANGLGLVALPQSPLPLPKKIEFEGVGFTYSDEENKLEVSSEPGQKVVITLELLKELGVRDIDKYTDEPVTIELVQSYELDEDCSKLLELKYDSNGVSGFVKRPNTPPLEEVYDAMENEKVKDLLKDLPAYSNSQVTYNAKPEAKKVSVDAMNSKALLSWQKDQKGNLTAKKGNSTITYNVSTGLFEVKGSSVILEQEDINNIESLTGKKLEKIEYKIKGKIILGQSLLNAGWQDSTGYFFGNYSYSRISDNVKLTSVENVVMYKYKDGAVYIIDNRDDKSEPIVLNEDDLNKVETKFGSTRIYSKFKVKLKTNSNNWTKHNSLRYYGFEKR